MDGEKRPGSPDRAATRLVRELWHVNFKTLFFWLPRLLIELEHDIIEELRDENYSAPTAFGPRVLQPARYYARFPTEIDSEQTWVGLADDLLSCPGHLAPKLRQLGKRMPWSSGTRKTTEGSNQTVQNT